MERLEEAYNELTNQEKVEFLKRVHKQEGLLNAEWVILTLPVLREEYFTRYIWIKEHFLRVENGRVYIAKNPVDNDKEPFLDAILQMGIAKLGLYIKMEDHYFSMLLDHVLRYDNFWNDLQEMLAAAVEN